MKKLKITLEIESKHQYERRRSIFEKLIRAFMHLVRNLRSRDKAELSRLIIVAFALLAQTYLLFWVLTFVLNRP